MRLPGSAVNPNVTLPLGGISLFQAMEAALMLVTVPFRPATEAFQMDAIRGGIANERFQSFSG